MLITLLNNNPASDLDKERKQEREAEYLSIIGKYKKNLTNVFSDMFVDMINLMEDKKGDYLGEFYQNNVTFGENGQFFTPEVICDMMTKINVLHE